MRTTSGFEFFTYALFDEYPGVTNIVTTRRDGDMAREDIRARLSAVTGTDAIVRGRQVHERSVAVVSTRDATPIDATDALVTATMGVPLLILVADCVSVSLYDPERSAIGVAHAGWRGTLADIAGQTVRVMADKFGCDPKRMIAGISPSIGPCCYEVGPDIATQFCTRHPAIAAEVVDASAREKLDLWRANALMLLSAGMRAENIETSARCTACHADTFYSYRAEKDVGRIANVVMLHGDDARKY